MLRRYKSKYYNQKGFVIVKWWQWRKKPFLIKREEYAYPTNDRNTNSSSTNNQRNIKP